jgi:DNA-binding MarR family transcriptional regulator
MSSRERIVAFVGAFHADHGYYPTIREIGKGVGLAPSSVHGHLLDLVDEGRIVRLQVTTDRFVWAIP